MSLKTMDHSIHSEYLTLVHTFFERQANRTAGAIVLVFESQSFTYYEDEIFG